MRNLNHEFFVHYNNDKKRFIIYLSGKNIRAIPGRKKKEIRRIYSMECISFQRLKYSIRNERYL